VSATVLYMSMSLDGFIAGPNEGPDNGLGDGGHRLHEWAPAGADAEREGSSGRLAGAGGQVVDEFMTTGAVVCGRGTFEPAGGWGGDHHDGVPIFILTRQSPESAPKQSEAKRAAGEKNVLVHGAGTAQLAIAAGVLDEHALPRAALTGLMSVIRDAGRSISGAPRVARGRSRDRAGRPARRSRRRRAGGAGRGRGRWCRRRAGTRS
jgi:dihydrofolate reductase